VVVINADLQDPLELIPDRAKDLQDIYDVVYAKRISAATFIYAAIILYEALAMRNPVRGYPSMMARILGVQLWSIAVNGEYLGRMLNETKQRPLYFVNHCTPAATGRQENQPGNRRNLVHTANPAILLSGSAVVPRCAPAHRGARK